MASAGRSPSLAAPARTTGLRQLWESGQRAAAVRRALAGWDDVLRQADDLSWLEQALRGCGLPAEAAAVQAERTRRSNRNAEEWEAFLRSILQCGDPWWARELLEDVGASSRELTALKIEVELAIGDAAPLIAEWVGAHHADALALEAAVRWWLRAGHVDEAERLVADAPGFDLYRARFALWRRQPQVARAILARLPPGDDVRLLHAIAALLEERLEDAEAELRSLIANAEQVEARTWLATVLRKQGRYSEAVQAADMAKLASTDVNLVAHLERDLAIEFQRQAGSTRVLRKLLRRFGLGQTGRTVRDLDYASSLYALGVKPDDPITALDGVLERFGGNHTFDLTTIDGTSLKSYRPPLDDGHLGVSVQRVLWTRGGAAARALYRDLAPRLQGHHRFRNYHGELELWLGNYGEAARIFDATLNENQRVLWAWIGLGASAMLQGDLREAQRIWARGCEVMRFEGPTLYAYRGECHRRQGNVEAARRDLQQAIRQKPQRLSAQINLALVEGQPEMLEGVVRQCTAALPFLMEELTGTEAERLEKVLEAMRGNRTSSPSNMSYHLWGRVWRVLG